MQMFIVLFLVETMEVSLNLDLDNVGYRLSCVRHVGYICDFKVLKTLFLIQMLNKISNYLYHRSQFAVQIANSLFSSKCFEAKTMVFPSCSNCSLFAWP